MNNVKSELKCIKNTFIEATYNMSIIHTIDEPGDESKNKLNMGKISMKQS